MHPLALLLLQIALVLAVARLVGRLFRRIGQPQVVGEMVAGILLGPSVLGALAPGVSAALFPADSLAALGTLSQIGLVLFMFLVGLEFDPAQLRGHGRTAALTSATSIALPFALGIALATFVHGHLAAAGVAFWPFALFLGAAMSVTAFPVLARILTERNLTTTRLGALAIACAAVDDVAAWSLLALVTAVATAAGPADLVRTLGGALVYAGAMVALARPLLARFERAHASRGGLSNDLFGLALFVLLGSAFVTESLGVHALFGAFVAGAVLPKGRAFVHDLTRRLEPVTVVLLLPLFFAATGLKTSIGLLSGTALWVDALLVLAVAIVGKFVGAALAVRASGLPWREASAVGVLMNTRGLMELVFVSVGLQLGIISPELFAMMVLMAIATTFMTTPLLARLVTPEVLRPNDAADADAFRVLVPVSLATSGPALLDAAARLGPDVRVTALHLTRATDRAFFDHDAPSADPLEPLLQAAERAGVPVDALAFVAPDVADAIADVAEARGADLVLVGWHRPVVGESILGGTVAETLRRVPTDVGVLVARRFEPWRRVLVPVAGSVHDRAALALALRFARSGGAVTVLQVAGEGGAVDSGPDLPELAGLAPDARARIAVRTSAAADVLDAVVDEARTGDYDAVLVGADARWGLRPTFFGRSHERLAAESPASLLIVRARPSAA